MEKLNNPIRGLIVELLESRYEGITFSDELVDSIETKVAPIVQLQTETAVVEFVSDYFSPKKPSRKARKPKAKVTEPEAAPTEQSPEQASTSEPVTEQNEPTAPSEAAPSAPEAEAVNS